MSQNNSKNSTKSKPRWRAVVDQADKLVTPAANNVVRTDLFADAVSAATRLEVRFRRRIDRQMTQIWHLYRLPSTVDMRRVLAHLAALEARLRDISERLDDFETREHAQAPEAPKASKAPKQPKEPVDARNR